MPLHILFKGMPYEIGRVLEACPAQAVNSGGHGMRYTVEIGFHKTYLFFEDARRWFVEEKVPHEISRVGGLVAPDLQYRF